MKLYRRKGSKLWWLTYSINGRRFRESTGTHRKQEAEAVLAKRRVEIFEERHFPDKRKSNLTMRGLRDLWLDHAARKRSIKDDRQRFDTLVEHFGPRLRIITLTANDIAKLKTALHKRKGRAGKPFATATVNRHLALLRSALKHADQAGYRHRVPSSAFKMHGERNQRDRICTDAEYDAFVAEAYPKLRLAIVFGFHTAMRLGEIAELTWDQIDLKAKEVRLRQSDTKTGEGRVVPLPPPVIDELRQWPQRIDRGRLIDVDKRTLSPAFKRLCNKLGIDDLRFHDLRHTAITRLRRAGVDLFTIAKISGHKDLQSLRRYNTIGNDDIHEAVRRTTPTKTTRSATEDES